MRAASARTDERGIGLGDLDRLQQFRDEWLKRISLVIVPPTAIVAALTSLRTGHRSTSEKNLSRANGPEAQAKRAIKARKNALAQHS